MLKTMAALLALSCVTASASAGVTTYTDRTQFQAALSSYTVDNLTGVPGGYISPGSSTTSVARASYSIGGRAYTCHYYWDCGEHTDVGMQGDFMAGFSFGTVMLTFDAPVKGFGVDFGADLGYGPTTDITINGVAGPSVASGFFGIISTDALSTFAINTSATGGILMDNVTYGDAVVTQPEPNNVPEPATALLLGVSAAGMAAARRRRAA